MRILISTQKLSATSLCPSYLVSRNFWYQNVAERDSSLSLYLQIFTKLQNEAVQGFDNSTGTATKAKQGA